MEFPIKKEPYLGETSYIYIYAKYKLFCKGIIVNQAGVEWIMIFKKLYRYYNPREKCHKWSQSMTQMPEYVFVSDTNRRLGETISLMQM